MLAACISVSIDSQNKTPAGPGFVTATLQPTKSGFIPATDTPPVATEPSTPTRSITQPANCKNEAILLRDVTIPDDTKIKPNETFTKTWEFKNTGTCNWSGYVIKFAAGDQMSAPLSAPIADTAPGSLIQVSVNLTAPAANGTYTGYFTLNTPEGRDVPIGTEKTFWVRIMVGSGIATAANTQSAAKTPYIPNGSNSNCSYTPNSGYAQQVINLINQARTNAKLKPLTVSSTLMAAAQAHSADMACNNFLDHTGSDGSWIGDRLVKAGYPWNAYYVEIIAIGSPQEAMKQWAADTPHWQAVLDPSATEIGAGYAYYADSAFGSYITVDMGRP